jgi:tetratricopeptide (TPR) repeat protein
MRSLFLRQDTSLSWAKENTAETHEEAPRRVNLGVGSGGAIELEFLGDLPCDSSASSVLSAESIFERLIDVCGCSSPPLYVDPLLFFADQLKSSLVIDEQSDEGSPAYSTKLIVDKVERARDLLTTATTEAQEILTKIQGFLQGVQYEDIIEMASSLADTEDLSREEAISLSKALITASETKKISFDKKLQALDLVSRICDKLLEDSADDSFPVLAILQSAVEKGLLYSGQEKHLEALVVFEEAKQRFAERTEPELMKTYYHLMLHEGIENMILEDFANAVEVFSEIEEKYDSSRESELSGYVISALINKGLALREMGKLADAVTSFNKGYELIVANRNEDWLESGARALLMKVESLIAMGKEDEAIVVCDDILVLRLTSIML